MTIDTVTNIVQRAIDKCGCSQSEFARRLAALSGKNVTRQAVHQWIEKGQVPRSMCIHVSALTGIELRELITTFKDSRGRPKG